MVQSSPSFQRTLSCHSFDTFALSSVQKIIEATGQTSKEMPTIQKYASKFLRWMLILLAVWSRHG
jgi:hypothetical protein